MSDVQYIQFRERVLRALALPNRNMVSQAEFAPELAYGRHGGPALATARIGAVLLLLYPVADEWNLVLTVRMSHLSTHAGQVSLPGGRIEPGETPEQAALREFEEELGPAAEIEVLGRLPEVNVYASNFLVYPVVAATQRKPSFIPTPAEVADVLELSLGRLAARERRGRHWVQRGPLRFSAPHLQIQGHPVWGATWIILGGFLDRLETLGPIASCV